MLVELRSCRSHTSNQVELSGGTIGTPYHPPRSGSCLPGK